MRDDQPPVPDRHRGLPAGQAAHARVPLRFPRQVRGPARLRAAPDGHGQQLHGAVGPQPRGVRPPAIESGIQGRKKELAGVGQTQRPHAGALQARMRGRWHDRPVLQMLLRAGRQNQIQHEGHVKTSQRGHVGPLQTGTAQQLRLGGKPRFPHGRRPHDDVHAGEAGAQRVLRQTLGPPRWRPHRADRVSHGRELSIGRHNEQLFTNKVAFGPVRQIIDDRLICFGHIFNDLVDFQRPDRVCCPLGTSNLKLARLIQIPHIDERRKLFSFTPTGLK